MVREIASAEYMSARSAQTNEQQMCKVADRCVCMCVRLCMSKLKVVRVFSYVFFVSGKVIEWVFS